LLNKKELALQQEKAKAEIDLQKAKENLFNSFDSKRNLARLGFNKQRIAIKNRWFDVLKREVGSVRCS
jgi:hypothetical protein